MQATGPMDHATTKLYEQSPALILVWWLLHLKGSAFQFATADAAAADGSRGSNVYKVNQWLWQFGRGRPSIGGLSVSETEERCNAVNRAGSKRSHETCRRREAARRGDE